MNRRIVIPRREFLVGTSVMAAALVSESSAHAQRASLAGKIGLVSASAHAQLTGAATGRKFSLLDLPKIMRDELDLSVIDLNTTSFPDFSNVDAKYIAQLIATAEANKCQLTNLKMNQRGFDMNSPDKKIRDKAIAEYKRSIDIVAKLGCRWVRPLPSSGKPDIKLHVQSFRELCEYAETKQITVLVENFGWMSSEPNSVSDLVKRVGKNVAAGVDTGNWSGNSVRYPGLQKSFPLAVTCDFKARRFAADGSHAEYDLKRCFDIAWKAGFRGPWAIEHSNRDSKQWFAGVKKIRVLLRQWTQEAEA